MEDLEGLKRRFEGLVPYKEFLVNVNFLEIVDSSQRSGEHESDSSAPFQVLRTEQHEFDNIYLTKDDKLAFVSTRTPEGTILYLPFNYGYTERLVFRSFHRDITWKIESISTDSLRIDIPEELTFSVFESGSPDYEHGEYGQVLVDQNRSFHMHPKRIA